MKNFILHYDMDSFFASIEQRDNIKYKNKPIIVGRGTVTSASYEARKYGIHSAMPSRKAYALCRNLITVPGRVSYYREVGHDIQSYISTYFDTCEFVSIDEGYIDINPLLSKYTLENIAIKFKKFIFSKYNLTCSVGIGFSKLSAKIASDINKPNGFFCFRTYDNFIDYLYDKNLKIIPGIGKQTVSQLNSFNIFTVGDLFKKEKSYLMQICGTNRGQHLYDVIRNSLVSKISTERKRQSFAQETTFSFPVNDYSKLKEELEKQSIKLSKQLKVLKVFVKTVSLKLRYSDFSTFTRSKTLFNYIDADDTILETTLHLLDSFESKDDIRLIGISLSTISNTSAKQLTLF